jgi:hypothetical protein
MTSDEDQGKSTYSIVKDRTPGRLCTDRPPNPVCPKTTDYRLLKEVISTERAIEGRRHFDDAVSKKGALDIDFE